MSEDCLGSALGYAFAGNFLKLANIFLGRTLFAAPGVMREEISGTDDATYPA
ncbi:MAG: hypothetical protein ACRD19_00975 [Terriglobia bacterium]